MTWTEYWNQDTTIYVNDRHKRVHYEKIAQDVRRLVPSPAARVADYGCGEAISADQIAAACGELILCDSAETVRQRLAARYADRENIDVIGPEAFEALPASSIDMIVVNSVVQYLSRAEFGRLLQLWRDKLRPGGQLILADVVPPDVSPYADAFELLKFAAANGFAFAAFAGLVRSYFSGYRQTRERLGFLQLSEAEASRAMQEAGLTPRRHHPNIGHNSRRMTFVGTPARAVSA
jgi:SAM-dependent methyltransferase